MELINAEEWSREYSDFHIINRSKVRNLKRGMMVKVFNSSERFWVEIRNKNLDGSYDAIVKNKLVFSGYDFGDIIRIRTENIIDVKRINIFEDMKRIVKRWK